METLVYLAYASIPVMAIVVGFLFGAIGNLFGLDFWTCALVSGGVAGAYQAGQVFSIR